MNKDFLLMFTKELRKYETILSRIAQKREKLRIDGGSVSLTNI